MWCGCLSPGFGLELVDLTLVVVKCALDVGAVGHDIVEGVAECLLDLEPVGDVGTGTGDPERRADRLEVGLLPVLDGTECVAADRRPTEAGSQLRLHL